MLFVAILPALSKTFARMLCCYDVLIFIAEEEYVRKLLAFSALMAAVCLLTPRLQAQGFDVAFGISTVHGTSATNAGPNNAPVSVGGGVTPSFSADFLFLKHFGVGGEVAWRATQANYLDIINYRPLFYDFNAVWAPPIAPKVVPEFQAGIGAESIRFYTGSVQCSGFTGQCTNYQSSNHFMGHFAAGLRLYPFGHFFVRPEVHVFLVNNNQEFSSGKVERYGVSIGYTFGGQP